MDASQNMMIGCLLVFLAIGSREGAWPALANLIMLGSGVLWLVAGLAETVL